jgi:AcrR family transcriptional regulator
VAGRPRDAAIDQAILAAALRLLAEGGYEALSMAAVAEAARTTRTALYRRYRTKADLATAAIASLRDPGSRPLTDDPWADLVAELEAFREGVSRARGVAMVGTMLAESVDPELKRLFRRRIVAPRRTRLRTILERAAETGMLSPGADVDTAVSMLTGSWYAMALAGVHPPPDWAHRVVTVVRLGLARTDSSGGGRR